MTKNIIPAQCGWLLLSVIGDGEEVFERPIIAFQSDAILGGWLEPITIKGGLAHNEWWAVKYPNGEIENSCGDRFDDPDKFLRWVKEHRAAEKIAKREAKQ